MATGTEEIVTPMLNKEAGENNNTAVVAPTVGTKAPVTSALPTMPISQLEKPEKFKGTNFKRWQQKMLFYLTTLSVTCFLKETSPVLSEHMLTTCAVTIFCMHLITLFSICSLQKNPQRHCGNICRRSTKRMM